MRINIRRRILQVTRVNNEEERKRYGITGKSSFFCLLTVHFNWSWPYDSLHCILSNIVPQLILLFRGEEYFENPDLNNSDNEDEDADNRGLDDKDTFVLDVATWETIGREMENSRMTVPTQPFGRPPRDINTKHNTFKAAEWSSWLLYYSIPLLQGRLPEKYMNN